MFRLSITVKLPNLQRNRITLERTRSTNELSTAELEPETSLVEGSSSPAVPSILVLKNHLLFRKVPNFRIRTRTYDSSIRTIVRIEHRS